MPHPPTPRPRARRDGLGTAAAAAATVLAVGLWTLTLSMGGCGGPTSGLGGAAAGTADTPTTDLAPGAADAAPSGDAQEDSPEGPKDATSCVSDDQCPRGGPCKLSQCVEGRCEWEPSPDLTVCDDGDACTVGTTCFAGTCGGGTLAPCEDGNPCTVDSCSPVSGCEHAPAPMGGACDDGDPCTHADACREDGTCLGEPLTSCGCASDADCAVHEDGNLCNGTFTCVAGACALDPATVIACPPAGPCRTSSCSPLTGQCVPTLLPDGVACDDQNPCTSGDTCQAGTCAGAPGACACTQDSDCLPFAAPGYDLCQGGLRCLAGVCAPDPSAKVSCPPMPPGSCVVEACDPATGLCEQLAVADGTACSGGEPGAACADVGACALGQCVTLGSPCDDGDPCTADVCDPTEGCVHTPSEGLPCDDGDPCTLSDVCDGGACAGIPAGCDDGDPCTLDSCASQSGSCLHTAAPDGTPCGETACTTGGTCQGGVCEGTQPVQCPPTAPCGAATCVPGEGCVTAPAQDGAPCDDGDPCTQPGTCVAGACQALPIPCADDNPCTADSCDPSSGTCAHAALADGASCTPADPCALAGKCVAGTCATTEPIECPPVPCTKQGCDPATGLCDTVAWTDGASCDAGPCAAEGLCVAGSCAPTAPASCDDGDACTADLCDPALGGCVHLPAACQADDTSACVTGTCGQQGTCESALSDLCTSGLPVLDETFACGAPTAWATTPDSGDWALSVTEPGLPPGPFGAGCALGLQGKFSASTGAGAQESTATRGAFYVPTAPGGTVTLRVRLFEAASPGLNAARSLRLLDGAGMPWATITWDDPTEGPNAVAASGGSGGWQERVFEIHDVGPGPWSLQVALSPGPAPNGSGPSDGGGGGGATDPASSGWWWIDHLVLSATAN